MERISGLLDVLADPHHAYPVIHVAGTNGKSSTVALAAALLASHGLSVGSFTSPHLERVEERFALNGVAMAPDDFAAAMTDVAPICEFYEERSGQAVTYFELTTALALAWFADRAVDAAVVEVGLGGRLDATNVLDSEVAVVTSIGVDHTEYLGQTEADIAAEKVAILKDGGTLVSGTLPEASAPAIAGRVAETGARWSRLGTEFRIEHAVPAVGGWHLDLEGIHESYDDVFLGVHGRHQVDNLAVAVAACEELTGSSLDLEAVRAAAASIELPGRLEVLVKAPLLVVDGAHNPDGFEALSATLALEFPTHHWVLVFGTMADKDAAGMLEAIAPRVSSVVTVAPPSERALRADRAARVVGTVTGLAVSAAPSVAEALERALVEAGADGSVLVAGSLYLAGAVRGAWRATGYHPGPHGG